MDICIYVDGKKSLEFALPDGAEVPAAGDSLELMEAKALSVTVVSREFIAALPAPKDSQIQKPSACSWKIMTISKQLDQAITQINDSVKSSNQMVSKIKLLQQLRLNEALFVYVGDDIEKLEKALIKELGYEVAMETLNAVFDLGSAQLPDSVKKSFLDACS